MANLENLSLPSTLEFANVQSFAGAAKLKQLVLPQALKTLGNYAFADLSSVTSVTVPDSVTDIGKNVFRAVIPFTDFTVPYVGKYSDREIIRISDTFSARLLMICNSPIFPHR